MFKKIRGQVLVWRRIIGKALTNFKLGFGGSATTYLVLIFAVVLAGNVMAFDYYQARITRYHTDILYTNVVRMNGDIDALEAKLSQLSAKIDGLETKLTQLTTKTDALAAKLDKPGPPTSLAPPPRRCNGIFC